MERFILTKNHLHVNVSTRYFHLLEMQRHNLSKITFIQSLFVVHPMTATASSTYVDDKYGPAEMAINGILNAGSDYDDMFNSNNDNYPWLAVDLGYYYKVNKYPYNCN